MPTPSHSTPSHNAAVVIRERIKERRLFEAQFLFGLLDEDDVSPQERLTLERELDGLLAIVRDLHLQANKYLAEGEPDLARKMHREMERIAIDVPGLSSDTAQNAPGVGNSGERVLSEERELPAAPKEEKKGKKRRKQTGGKAEALLTRGRGWLSSVQGRISRHSTGRILLVALVLACILAVVVFLNLMQRHYSDASLKSRAGEDIAISPLSILQGEADAIHTDPGIQAQQAQETAPASDTNISIGDLSVESGSSQ